MGRKKPKVLICPHCQNNVYAKPVGIASPDGFLTKEQVAALLQVVPRTLDSFMVRGLIPYIKIGRTVRFRLQDIVKHLYENQDH
jgi:excisionase family DNA binding protein